MSQNIKVFLSSLKMAIATFCSRILGLVREQFIAYLFGASGLTDAFLVAYRIPNMLRDLFAEGAFSAAFVPTFVAVNIESKEKARKLLWALVILLTIVSLSIATVICIFTPEIINIFAPTFKDDPSKFEVTILLTRIMSPFLCLISVAALFMGVLNSLKIFFIPSFAPVFFNISMIVSMLILPGYFISIGVEPIVSLGVGALVGGLAQALVQFPLILKHKFGPVSPGKIFSKETKKVLILLGPGLLGFAASQINLLVNTILASSTVIGAVSWLSFSFRLFQLPVGILSVSIGNSNLVHFSDAWKKGKEDEAKGFLSSSFFLSCFLVMPAMIALFTCADEMISVIFEHGKFSAHSTQMTAKALRWYALGLPMYSIYKIFVPTFYAIDRQKIPVICSVIGIVVNIGFCIYFTPIYGFEVLALGTTISMLLNTALQGVILKKDLKLSLIFFFNLRILKLILASAVTYLFILWLKLQVIFTKTSFVNEVFVLGLYLLAIALCYFFLCVILGERKVLYSVLSRLFKRKRT